MNNKELIKERRKHLDDRLRTLQAREMMIEEQLAELDDQRFYRVCIFGSARIKPESREYNEVFELAKLLSCDGIDTLTGGGPGLMEAANRGAQEGRIEKKSRSKTYGLSIRLEWEPIPNPHLDIKHHHNKFSSRLDEFMRLSDAVIATPGGIGTLLELYFTWQLIQVKHIGVRPIVLLDKKFWSGLIEWMKTEVLQRGLVSEPDFSYISIVDTPEEAYKIISDHHQNYVKNLIRKDAAS